MFENLSDKLGVLFKKLRGETRLTESNIAETMRDIRLALLDADVNIDVARDFVEKVRQDCLGEAVLKSVTPGQQVVKIVNDRLIELMGGEAGELNLAGKPTVIMLVGLHGSGKTTTAAKRKTLRSARRLRRLPPRRDRPAGDPGPGDRRAGLRRTRQFRRSRHCRQSR